jgi:lysine/ornithine N-monooxygenase
MMRNNRSVALGPASLAETAHAPSEVLYNAHLTFKRRDDVVRYLKRHEWEQVKESAIGDLWYHRGYCTAAVDMQTAMALTLACQVKSLQRENGELREKIRKLKARKC